MSWKPSRGAGPTVTNGLHSPGSTRDVITGGGREGRREESTDDPIADLEGVDASYGSDCRSSDIVISIPPPALGGVNPPGQKMEEGRRKRN